MDLDGFFFQGWVCDTCLDSLNRHGLAEFVTRKDGLKVYPSEEEIDPLIDLLDLQPMCAQCFEELNL